MIDKEKRNKLLNMYTKKEEKIFVGHLIDLANKFEVKNIVIHTEFLDLNERYIAENVFNFLKVKYKVLDVIEDIQRVVIFLIPEYLEDFYVFDEYISCVKILPNMKNKLMHKDYMGAIYNLGISQNKIGDIFVCEDICYLFTFIENTEYIQNNLLYVGKVEVKLDKINLNSDEVKSICLNYKSLDVTIQSLRVDVLLSSVYNLSRNEVKSKIEAGDLFINSKNIFWLATLINEGDILSFKKCGKLKIGKIIRITKNGKIVLNVKKYI